MVDKKNILKENRTLKVYSDYGDITGIQAIRRLIKICNDNFEKIEARLQQLEDGQDGP